MSTARMNAVRWVVATAVFLALGAGGGYWWAHYKMDSVGSTMGASAPATSARAMESASANVTSSDKGRILYWHDPMVPNQKFDKPGKSPFMDMQLVPVYANETGEGGDVRVNASVVQNLGIRLGRVERTAITGRLRAVGSVAFDERLLELVQPRVEGYVTRLMIKAPLERVRRGQPLAEILAPQWLEAEQEYLALMDASSERAQTLREAARQRLAVLGVSEVTIHAVETTRRTNANATIVAPIDGVVTELGARQGAAFMSGASLFRINGLSTVWVNAQIPEAKVSLVPVGAMVEARATGWPGMVFKGRVIAMLPDVDPATRTLTARVSIENRDEKLSPGMYVGLDFTGPLGEPQLMVPSEAIITTGERNVVIAAHEGGGFDVVNVMTGAEQGGRTAILSGLTEGQSIVVSGQFLIDSEASLKSTVNRLQTATPPAAGPAASDTAPSARHLARGRITAITPESITIAHEPVPSLSWPAMTMGFKPPTQGVSKDLKVGDQVSFSFTAKEGGSFQLEAITALQTNTTEPSR